MQPATDNTVQGDFSGAKFGYDRIESRFFKRGGKFFVHTDGADGAMADFQIAYTFGVAPLQQYLIAFSNGRLQPLSIAWDTRPRRNGGQRWFHLYPRNAIDHRDPLHWTRSAQNWNFMCGECHVTGFEKNYDLAADKFATRWSELGVGCEACHGPGSAHVEWANSYARGAAANSKNEGLTARLDEGHGVIWTRDPQRDTATRSSPRTDEREIEVCAQCHARRAPIAAGYRPGDRFLDYYLPALLMPGVYDADGQQRAEDYNWGSFLQSKMYVAGVTCSDCHEPHGGKVRAEGNALCGRCHNPEKFDRSAHHHHAGGSPGAQCANCHMPTNTYMTIDPRHDHGLRPPRPDVSTTTDAPNACNACHKNRDAQWATAQAKSWWGENPDRLHRYAAAFAAADAGTPGASAALRTVASETDLPAIARASAIARLDPDQSSGNLEAIAKGTRDTSPLVRLGAVEALMRAPPKSRLAYGATLLSDPYRAIRIDAAEILAGGLEGATEQGRDAFRSAAAEFVASQRFNADRPQARTALGAFELRRGNFAQGVNELEASIRLDPTFAGAYVDLADAFGDAGQEAQAESTLRAGLDQLPRNATLHHALGLALVRVERADEALRELAEATKLDRVNARFAYVYGVAQHSFGRPKEAIATLKAASIAHPGDRDTLEALATFYRDAGDQVEADRYAERLRAMSQ